MTRLGKFSVTLILIAGLAVSLLAYYRSQARLRDGETLLREQSNQLSALGLEHQRLSVLAAYPAVVPSNQYAAELTRLRGEVEALRKRTNALARTSNVVGKSQGSQPVSSTPAPHTPEYYQQMRDIAGSKPWETRDLGRAFGDYAQEHQNQSPASLDELLPYLAKNGAKRTGTNQYEIIYHGSLDQLKGLPWGSIAVIRDAQPWPGPDGTMMRTYGFPDGHSQMVTDNLQSWISEHVIAPPAAGEGGR